MPVDETTQFIQWLTASSAKDLSFRALGTNQPTGGATLVPAGLIANFYSVLEKSPVRSLATLVETADGAKIDFPAIVDAESGVLLAENGEAVYDDAEAVETSLGSFSFHSKILKVSRELIEDASPTLLPMIGRALGNRVARICNFYFTTGTGSGQPRGVVTAATVGKTVADDVAVTYTDLVDLMTALPDVYEGGAHWMMNGTTLGAIRKLSGTPQPLFSGINGDLLLGKRVVVNPAMPAMAADNKTILYGDFSAYLVREVKDPTLRSYRERYATEGQVGFAAILRADGDLADENAVVALRMAGS